MDKQAQTRASRAVKKRSASDDYMRSYNRFTHENKCESRSFTNEKRESGAGAEVLADEAMDDVSLLVQEGNIHSSTELATDGLLASTMQSRPVAPWPSDKPGFQTREIREYKGDRERTRQQTMTNILRVQREYSAENARTNEYRMEEVEDVFRS